MSESTRPMPKSGMVYQFVRFNLHTITSLLSGTAYYGDHTLFNDPFDCNVTLTNDLPLEKLEELSNTLWARIKEPHSLSRFFEPPTQEQKIAIKKEQIWDAIRRLMKPRGVLCLSEQFNHTLMWAHYADKHAGLCLEYKVHPNAGLVSDFRPVDYTQSSVVPTSLIYDAAVMKQSECVDKLIHAYFFRKTGEWTYEREWRALMPNVGPFLPPGKLTAVLFGLKCPNEAMETIIRIFGHSEARPRFGKMEAAAALEAETSRHLRCRDLTPSQIDELLCSVVERRDEVYADYNLLYGGRDSSPLF